MQHYSTYLQQYVQDSDSQEQDHRTEEQVKDQDQPI